ncbi:MAG: dihydroorotase [Acidiphilium sp. 37-64-53]|uniref:dihydroorotase n=1 Tax=Acidiphilium TaxID=522 RepID=UPI000BC63A55|nr:MULTISPECIES: dihydroorotase [Acidiphilium]OYW02571.1 MAG: dihydroorotase [Acidiphilium sp. 37-64-53]OZB29860.1 MAG: dihydroorotase [Acidiphilium sp. 34-64-41]HQT84048.1 dihydroorotase [Acidiphilium rubrum]
MRDTLITGARIIDPASGHDAIGDCLIRGGMIADFAGALGRPADAMVVDGADCILCPGLVDGRASLGEPGFEYRETIASAALAASAGGITTIAVLPDNAPPTDDPALVRALASAGEASGRITIAPYGAATRGCRGESIAEYGLLRAAGAIAFSDGARAIGPAGLMRRALSYARGFGAMIVQHPEEPSLAAGGAATSGARATLMGLPGIPVCAEAMMVARDITLVELTGGAVHFAHVSTGAALDLIRAAKARGLAVSCDTAPPYFDLNETAIGDFRTYAKLSPPLRSEDDRLAVVAALADGTIDAIGSDHQPRDADDKRLPFAEAAPGGAGLATLLAITLAQVQSGALTLHPALSLLTDRPARRFGLDAGRIVKGGTADLCLFAPERSWRIEAGKLPGKARNTPFDGRAVEGVVIGTWKAGVRVFG